LLKDDLDDLIREYPSNDRITPNQRKQWRKEGRKAAITHPMLGKDHPNCLKLLSEDGFDGRPVGSLSSRAAEGFWDYNTGHIFPPMKDLIRFGVFMKIDIYQLLTLILKGEWERFFAHHVNGWRPNAPDALLIDILKQANVQKMREASRNFNPDTQEIFDLFEHYGKVATQAGYNARQFDTLAQEIILKELHWRAGNSKAVVHFIQNRRLKNREIERQWLCIFGDLEVELFEQKIRLIMLERKILLKQTDPELTLESLDGKLGKDETTFQKSLENLKHETAIAPALEKSESGGAPVEEQKLADYHKECRTLVRKIRFLIHPDHLDHHPNYSKLTDNQKKELSEILQECLNIDTDELGFPKGFIEHEMRSAQGLKRVLERIEIILSAAGIDLNAEYEIQGRILKEQLEWLCRENQWLEKEIAAAKSTLEALMKNQDILRKQGILGLPDQHAKIREDLKKKAETDREKADHLEQELLNMI